MNRTKELSIRLKATGGDKLRRQFNTLGKDGRRAFDGISRATRPASLGIKAVDASARALNNVFRQGTALIGAYFGVHAIGNIIATADAYNLLQSRIKLYADTADEAREIENRLFKAAQDSRQSLESTATVYARLAPAREQIGINTEELIKLTETLNNLALVGGASTREATAAMIQFSQSMASGEFRGEEFRSVSEQLPLLLRQLEKELGKTTGELREMAHAGKLTSDIVVPALLNGYDDLKDRVSSIAVTTEQSVTRLSNTWTRFIDRFDEVSGFTRTLSSSIGLLTASFENLSNATNNKATQSFGELFELIVTNGTKALTYLIENADIAVDALTALLIARTVGGAFNAMNVAMIGNAGATIGLKLMASLSVATASKIVILEGASRLATIAMTGLRGVMTLLGGPAGIVAITGYALYQLVTGHDAASKAARDHADEIVELRQKLDNTTDSIEKLNQASREETLARLTQKLSTAKENIANLKEELKYGAIGGFFDQMSRFGTDLLFNLREVRNAFVAGKISVDEYQHYIWKLANKHPDFTDNAKEVNELILTLKGAELAAKNASDAIQNLDTVSVDAPDNKPIKRTINLEESNTGQKFIDDAYKQYLRVTQQRIKLIELERDAKLNQLADLKLNEEQYLQARTNILLTADAQIKAIKDKQAQDDIDRLNNIEAKQSRFIQNIEQLYLSSTNNRLVQIEDEKNKRLSKLESLNLSEEEYIQQRQKIHEIASIEMIEYYKNEADEFIKSREEMLKADKSTSAQIRRTAKTLSDEASDLGKNIAQAFTNSFSNLENALVNFTTKGKLEFKDLANSILSDIARIIIRQQIIAPLANATGTALGAFFTPIASASAHPASLATGGYVRGPGTATSDSIPVMLSNGEYVINAKATNKFKPLLDRINTGEISHFNRGGFVGNNNIYQSNSSAPIFNIQVMNNGKNQVDVQKQKNASGGFDVKIFFKEIESFTADRLHQGIGPIHKVLTHKYNLNPGNGAQ